MNQKNVMNLHQNDGTELPEKKIPKAVRAVLGTLFSLISVLCLCAYLGHQSGQHSRWRP